MKNKTGQNTIGYYSAVLAAVEVTAFALALVVGLWAPLVTPAYIAAFLLAPTFVAMMVALHYSAPEDRKIWTSLGVAAAVAYATTIAVVYYTQLAVVRLNPLGLPEATIKLISFTPGSFLFAVDMLGYALMSLATLIVAPVFAGERRYLWVRRLYLINGLLFLPTLIFPLTLTASAAADSSSEIYGTLALIAWALIFVPLATLTAGYFKDKKT